MNLLLKMVITMRVGTLCLLSFSFMNLKKENYDLISDSIIVDDFPCRNKSPTSKLTCVCVCGILWIKYKRFLVADLQLPEIYQCQFNVLS